MLSTGTYLDLEWSWTTPAVLGISITRNFVALQGYFHQKMHRMNENKENLMSSSLLEICINSPYCEAISKDDQNSFFQYEKILTERFINDTAWTTVLPLNLALLKNKIKSGFIFCRVSQKWFFLHYVDIDLCCPETEEIKNIKIGRREVIVQVYVTLIITIIIVLLIVDLPWRVQRYKRIFYCWIHHEEEACNSAELSLFLCRRWT